MNYEDIVRDYYNRYRWNFITMLTAKYRDISVYEAEDLYQDTFLAIQDNLKCGRIRENTSWGSYIMAIGLNLANKRMRSYIPYFIGDEIDDVLAQASKTTDDILKELTIEDIPMYQDPEAQALLGDELTHTPEPCASIIRLYYYENLSMDEIAKSVCYKNAATAKAKKSQCMTDLVKRVKKVFQLVGLTD